MGLCRWAGATLPATPSPPASRSARPSCSCPWPEAAGGAPLSATLPTLLLPRLPCLLLAGPIPDLPTLVRLLATVAWTASAHHAAVNFGQVRAGAQNRAGCVRCLAASALRLAPPGWHTRHVFCPLRLGAPNLGANCTSTASARHPAPCAAVRLCGAAAQRDQPHPPPHPPPRPRGGRRRRGGVQGAAQGKRQGMRVARLSRRSAPCRPPPSVPALAIAHQPAAAPASFVGRPSWVPVARRKSASS